MASLSRATQGTTEKRIGNLFAGNGSPGTSAACTRQSMHDRRVARLVALERGNMSRLHAFLLLVALTPVVRAEHVGLCKLPYCECVPAGHPSWTVVNCTIPKNQKLDIFEGDLPETTTDLILSGAEAVMFGVNSLSRLKDARHIHINGPNVIVMRKYSAVNLNIVNLYLDIENSDVLRIEERTFTNIKGPLSVTIRNCDVVSLEGETFSWLLTMNITNVRELQLGPGSFTLDPTAANVGEHGPGMSIDLKNTNIREIATQTFGSSAAGITMESVNVQAIRTGAFTANTYNIVMAVNCSFHLIEDEAFSQKSLIHHLNFYGCRIQQLASKALQSAVGTINISHSRFENIETGAINTTVATVVMLNNVFHTFMERGFELSSWNKLQMEGNSFDDLVPNAIVAPGASIHELIFKENEIETVHPDSLAFIGQAQLQSADNIVYKSNYYGQTCHCNISLWLGKVLGTDSIQPFEAESYCTVNEFFARCFNVPEQNMVFQKFLLEVCTDRLAIQCETFKSTSEGAITEIKNPRFPHKSRTEPTLTDREKKVIGIVVVSCLVCVLIVMFVSFVRWMRRKGHCVSLKNLLISSNSSCGSLCDRLCVCGMAGGLDSARSISQISVNEYSERHRLNEPRVQDIIQESNLNDTEIVPTDDKTTQTLPEELTKELLENLKDRLDNPENYTEAREMIEHLYELTKMEENCNKNTHALNKVDENIYELPFQNTTPRVGRNKKQMISVGTRTPSLDKLMPLSPYNRQTALIHEYLDPKDLTYAVHLYAEIANSDKEKRTLLGAIPDLVAEQPVPRGPYLCAVRDKLNSSPGSSPSSKSFNSSMGSPRSGSTIKSTTSNSSAKMVNRPLPEKPISSDTGEGTSFKHG